MKYLIISPVRNEEKYIRKTIISVANQLIQPSEWVIVNDGSNDNTEGIIKEYISKYPWMKIVNKIDRGFTQVGKGVIEAFNVGMRNISSKEWKYIVKMDCDLILPENYFKILIDYFESNNRYGIIGGTSYSYDRNILYEEKMPEFHPWAGARMYRRECFEDISGLVENLGWDTIDLLRAQMKGWETKRFHDLKIVHLRKMSSRKGLWEGKLRLGRNFYITGYHPLFLIARSIYHLKEKPYFIESAGAILGYLQALLKQESLIITPEEKRYLQRQQLRRLIGLKI